MQNILLFLLCTAWVSLAAVLCRRWGQGALFVGVVLQALLANWMVLKQITLFGLNTTPSDPFMIGSALTLSFLQDLHGPQAARKALFFAWASLVFFCGVALIQTHYLPSPSDSAHAAYMTLLSPTPRLVAASALSYFLSERLNIGLYQYFLKRPIGTQTARWSAIILSQAFDTVFFSLAGLYGLVHPLMGMMVMSYIIKLLCCFCIVPWCMILVRTLPVPETSK